MFGIFLFLTYYLQETLGYSPVMTGVAFLPMVGAVIVSANLANIVLLPRVGPVDHGAGHAGRRGRAGLADPDRGPLQLLGGCPAAAAADPSASAW